MKTYLLFNPAAEPFSLTLASPKGITTRHIKERRQLSRRLLASVDALLAAAKLKPADITALGIVTGPGSFTSLRITTAVVNALAYANHLPIVVATTNQAATPSGFADFMRQELAAGRTETMVLPDYGREPTITPPKGRPGTLSPRHPQTKRDSAERNSRD